MIPRSLHLTDFLSYRHMEEPLDLSGIHVACLSGANGHGKSALLDAMTWALWGKARGCEGGHDQEKVIRDGADTARVEMEFELDEQVYRVARQRSRTGKADLLFNVRAPDGSWTNLAGEGIADTQRRISERLRMEYETFVASAFVLQGRADEFTKKRAAERKDVLGKILGLEIYERLADRAKEHRRTHEAHAEAHRRDAENLEAALEAVPELEASLAEALRLEEDAAARRKTAETAAAEANIALAGAHAVEKEMREAARRRDEIAASLAAVRAEIATLDAEAAAATEAARAEESLRSKAATAAGLQERAAALEESRARDLSLAGEEADLQRRVDVERAKITEQRRGLERNAAELAGQIAALEEAPSLLAKAEQSLRALEEAEAEREELLVRHRTLDARRAEEEKARQHRRETRDELVERVEKLSEAEAECPLCAQSLTGDHRARISAELQERLGALDAADARSREELASLAAELETVLARGKALKKTLGERPKLEQAAAELRERVARAATVKEQLLVVQAGAGEIARIMETDADAPTERQKLASIRGERTTLAYDPAAHKSVRDQLIEAQAAERALQEAAKAAARLELIVRQREGAARRAGDAEASLEAADREVRERTGALASLPALEAAAAEADAAVGRTHDEILSHRTAAAGAKDRLAALADTAARARRAREDLKESRVLAKRYELLQKAFGRDGIPARIIGNAIPELVSEANRLLGLLTDGRLTVKVDLTRPTKSKTVKETLDITVYDTHGKRSYEMYSGGERLRIDFALRIALSRLLARRANTRLETLVIDEGFGSQDAEGRARLVEAILKVRDDFRRILVITHVEDLKEQFPARIEVQKDEVEGSRVTIV